MLDFNSKVVFVTGTSGHIAKVAGLELMIRAPYFVDTGGENETTAQKPGNICYVPGSQNICIFCEDLPGLGPCSLIGKVTENLEGIQAEARKCKKKQGAFLEIYEWNELRRKTNVSIYQ